MNEIMLGIEVAKDLKKVKDAKSFIKASKKRKKRKKIRRNLIMLSLLIIGGLTFKSINEGSLFPRADVVQSSVSENNAYLRMVVGKVIDLKASGRSAEDICKYINARYSAAYVNITEDNNIEIGYYDTNGELVIYSSFPIK